MALEGRRIELPLPASRFIGRRAELARLESLFASGARLVTLWGPGGIGKTRLALQFAAAYARRLKQTAGAYLVDVASARDPLGLFAAVGRSLDVPLPPADSNPDEIAERIGHLLRARGPSLFVLDNFEGLAEMAPAVARWMQRAPDARFLVTSRERLRVAGEVVEELGPLSLVPSDSAGERSDAVELFLDRAQALGFVPDVASARLAAELCAALEGIPLAIELAAGRVDVLGVDGMLDPMRRLRTPAPAVRVSIQPRLDVLAGGQRDTAERQHSLRATIAWSWELLAKVERRALAQCAVFRDGFTPVAAARVLELGEAAPSTLDVIQSLRNKSLLRSYLTARGEVRLALYESVREFAAEQLERLGEVEAVEARHRELFLEIAPRLAERNGEGLRLLTAEHDNLMVIAERALSRPNPGTADATFALRALSALEPVFFARGPLALYLAWLDRALAVADDAGGVPPPVRAKALQARGRAHSHRGRTEEALADLSAALEAARASGDRSAEGTILADLGVLHHRARDLDQARSHYEQALAIHRGLGERRAIGRVLGNLGALHHDGKNFEEAMLHYSRALVICREIGDRRMEGHWLTNLGVLHQERGEAPEAQRHYEQALALLEQEGNVRNVAIALGNLASLHHEQGRLEAARLAHQRALERIRDVGDRRSEGLCLSRLGAVLADEGRLEEAAERFLSAEDLLSHPADPIGLEVVAVSRGFLDVARALAARAAGDEAQAEAHAQQARARIARARAGGPNRPAPAEINDDIRVALRIVERSLALLDAGANDALSPPDNALLVGPEAQWIRPPHGSWQDLRRRRPLRLLVMQLVEERENGNGAALSLEALRNAGWPGEAMSYDAAVNRIHVALAELRKRGLKPLLLKSDHGYLLDPHVEVRRVPGAMCPS